MSVRESYVLQNMGRVELLEHQLESYKIKVNELSIQLELNKKSNEEEIVELESEIQVNYLYMQLPVTTIQ